MNEFDFLKSLLGSKFVNHLMRDGKKAKAERMLVADVSASDLKILKKYNKKQDIDTIRTIEPGLSTGKHGITDQEIKDVLSGKIKKPTGIHKKK